MAERDQRGEKQELSQLLCYLDFGGIFDRSAAQKGVELRQRKAKSLFRPEGVTLDLGSGSHAYIAFERSASMSRKGVLSFIRADYREAVTRRIMMDLTVGMCQLSKLYAYNGLMMSSGMRMDGIEIDKAHRVIVVDNHANQMKDKGRAHQASHNSRRRSKTSDWPEWAPDYPEYDD